MSGHITVLRRVFADYNCLSKHVPGEWPENEPILVVVETPPPEQRDADENCFEMVVKALKAKDQHGWARFQSDVGWTGRSSAPVFSTTGLPLFAEWTTGAQASCRLRADPDAPGEVRIWTYTERDLGKSDDLQKDEAAFLRETVTVLGHRRLPSGTDLVYHIYWAAPDMRDPFALRRVFDRFAGFRTKEGK